MAPDDGGTVHEPTPADGVVTSVLRLVVDLATLAGDAVVAVTTVVVDRIGAAPPDEPEPYRTGRG